MGNFFQYIKLLLNYFTNVFSQINSVWKEKGGQLHEKTFNSMKVFLVTFSEKIENNFFMPLRLRIRSLENDYEKKFGNPDHIMKDDEIIKQNRSLIYEETINLLFRRQKSKFYNPFASFWPLFLTGSIALFLIFLCLFFHSYKLFNYLNYLTLISIFAVAIAVSFWFSIFFIEKKKGNHSVEVRRNIELGFYLFLFTEALCFLALFWLYFHSFLAAGLHIGIYNPGEGVANLYINETVEVKKYWNINYFSSKGTPQYIKISSMFTMMDRELYSTKSIYLHLNFYDRGQLINPYKLPLLNTFILLTSAACLNASHVAIRSSKYLKSFFWLIVTILLGLFFVSVQYREYKDCAFQYNDGIYAACFFSLTGLHGIHVMIGVSALIVCAVNLMFKNYSPTSHQSYIYSIFYWHFVDVIWIFVYFIIYLWPASYFFNDELYTNYSTFFTVNLSANCFSNIIKANNLVDFKLNNGIIYKSFCKSFDINYVKINTSFLDSYSPTIINFYTPKINLIKQFLSNKTFIENLFAIWSEHCNKYNIEFIINFIKTKTFPENLLPIPSISSMRLVRYSDVQGVFYPVSFHDELLYIKKFYEFEKPISVVSSVEFFEYENLRSEIPDLIDEAKKNGTNIFINLEKIYLKYYRLNKYRAAISGHYDANIEFLHNNLIYENYFNYNEIKRDPLLFCFIMTEMHMDLVYVVENAYINDLDNKYKRFFIYLFFKKLKLNLFLICWCFFFFPYIILNDTSIRHFI